MQTEPAADAPVGGHDEPVTAEAIVASAPLDRWRQVRFALLATYLMAYVVWFANFGVIVDRISVLVSIAVLLVIVSIGRSRTAWRTTAQDFALYTAMWIAYDETRGAADRLGMPLQVTSMRDADRFLFGGVDPNVWMQERWFSEEHVRWYDVVASIVYYSHFVVPVVVVAVLWVRRRDQWVRFVRRLATVLAIGCLSFVLLPTAPPWMAAGGSKAMPMSALPPLERPAGRGWDAMNLDAFVHAWETGRDWANPVAAMPSLHAAFALLVVAFFLPRIRRRTLRVLALAYPVVMGVSLVYLAEHWVVDVLAGWAVVGVAFAVWHRVEQRRTVRKVTDDAEVPVGVDS